MKPAHRERVQPGVGSPQLETLAAELAELRDGQHEILRMYEDLRGCYPKNCLCADMREQARAAALADDVFAPEPNNEDYRPE